MTPRARRIVEKRKQRRADAEDAIERDLNERNERARQEEREARRQPVDRVEEAAHVLHTVLKYGTTKMRQEAQQFLRNAPEAVRAKVQEKEDVNSPFKQRRSRQTNGY